MGWEKSPPGARVSEVGAALPPAVEMKMGKVQLLLTGGVSLADVDGMGKSRRGGVESRI